jgi:hypothetical protein
MFLPQEKELAYYALIRKIESGGNDRAKNDRSTASGRYQPIKSTWLAYGLDWSRVFEPAQQEKFIRLFTADNARLLNDAGCAINFATLYGAHFLGASGLLQVMRGTVGDSIATVTSAAQRKANPTILKGTIKDFCDWLERKTGDSVYRRYEIAGGITTPAPIVKPKENTVMNWLNGLVGKTAIQYLLTALGGIVLTNGWFTDTEWASISGALMIIIPAIFGIAKSATEKLMINGKVAKIAELTPATQATIAKEVAAK